MPTRNNQTQQTDNQQGNTQQQTQQQENNQPTIEERIANRSTELKIDIAEFNQYDLQTQMAIAVRILIDAGITDEDYCRKFVDANTSALFNEFNAEGVTKDNPFVQFIAYVCGVKAKREDSKAVTPDVFLSPDN